MSTTTYKGFTIRTVGGTSTGRGSTTATATPTGPGAISLPPDTHSRWKLPNAGSTPRSPKAFLLSNRTTKPEREKPKMKPTSNLINPNFPTIPGSFVIPGISALVRVLAKVDKGMTSPLRYGNHAQAEKKRRSLADRLTQEGSSSAVIQIESRFLVVVFPAGYYFDQKSGELVARSSADWRCTTIRARRPPFATVSGPRINPRNQHNHPHTLAANGLQPVYCAGDGGARK